jgi:hypothetical protein
VAPKKKSLTFHRPDERPSELTRNSSCQNTGGVKDSPLLGGVLPTAAWQRPLARSKKIATATWRLGASTSLVRMRHDYALKSAIKHRLRTAHFPMLPIIIECGRVVCDKPGHKASHATGHDGGGRAPSDKLATLGRNPCGDFHSPAKCVRFVINS